MRIDLLTIVGVGLIGGSIGLAAKRRGVAARVYGVGWRQATLDQARALGAIDDGFLELGPGVCEAEVVVFCTPVDRIVGQVMTAAPLCSAGTLLTDAGSTKGVIVRELEHRLPAPAPAADGQGQGVVFVGSHPLAGSEKRGPGFADADLFQGRVTVVTRTVRTPPAPLERTVSFWEALGSRVRVMEPDEHDRALALTSHLPHLLAAALAAGLPPELHELTATGFRDTTRVAAGDPALWTGIFLHNREPVLAALGSLRDNLDRFQAALRAGDVNALTMLLDQAKKVRDALGS
jgi:prephenate dehydrogenase